MDRRNFLRSATGAILALPSLESVAGSVAKGAVSGMPKKFAIFYSPIGFIRRGFFPGEADAELRATTGPNTPHLEGAVFQPGRHELSLTPTLEPLAEVKDRLTLVTGLDRTFQNGTDVHAQCASCFLSSAAPYGVKQSAWPLERTLDHIIGDHIGGSTPFRTLEFSANSHKDNKESIYFDNISWYGTGHVAPSLRDPLKAYQRLFGTSRADGFRDITSLVLEDAKHFEKRLGQADREKFGEYYESIREIERRIEKMEGMKDTLGKIDLEEPTAAHLPRGEYMSLMADLMIVALQAGLTNVATFMAGPERWDTPFTFEGLFSGPRSHHGMSHKPKQYLDDLLKLDRFHVEQFARVVKKMSTMREADGTTLLDNTLLTFGSGLGDGSTHQYNDLPIVMAGWGQKGGQLAVSSGTPLANLWLGQARAFGLGMERFADSTGELTPV